MKVDRGGGALLLSSRLGVARGQVVRLQTGFDVGGVVSGARLTWNKKIDKISNEHTYEANVI